MANKKNKKNKEKNEIIEKQFNKEIIGALLILMGVISAISLFSFQTGIIGSIIRGTSFRLLGFGAYFFPLLLVAIGLILIMDTFNGSELRSSLILLGLLLLFVIFLDRKNLNTSGFINHIKSADALSRLYTGGGLIGATAGFLYYKLFGKVGGYIILGALFIILSLMFTNTGIKEIIGAFQSLNLDDRIEHFIENRKLKKIKRENDRKDKERQDERERTLADSSSNLIETENVSISDYGIDSSLLQIDEEEDFNTIENYSENVYDIENIKSNESVEFMNVSNESMDDIRQEFEKDIKAKDEVVVDTYVFPTVDLLKNPKNFDVKGNNEEVLNNAKIIEDTMKNFDIDSKIVHINKGPTITSYELEPAPGIRLSKIVSLSDNIALSLASSDIRIEAPIPGKAAVGIEVPNKIKDNVLLKEMLLSDEFKKMESNIPLTLGKDVSGKPIISSIDKMPHLLIAGATGSGKSVCINTIIMSIIYKSSPKDTKLLMIDPKVVELSVYNDIPHLVVPVVTEAKKSAAALNWAVREMEDRYRMFANTGVRDIHGYNKKVEDEDHKLPNIVIIIDELADLMMVAAKEIEDYICRLAQMARAAGMYLIIATQRPSVDVITGTIKANIPSRISFAVSSQIDSRTILDSGGAEKLLGQGDMLFYPSNYSKPKRIQGAFISDEEVEAVVEFLKQNNSGSYDEKVIENIENKAEIDLLNTDPLIEEAVNMVIEDGQASISKIQRKLKVGFNRASEIMDEMENLGVVGPHEGNKPRKVLISKDDNIDNIHDLKLEED